jgi:hypothetical protein
MAEAGHDARELKPDTTYEAEADTTHGTPLYENGH